MEALTKTPVSSLLSSPLAPRKPTELLLSPRRNRYRHFSINCSNSERAVVEKRSSNNKMEDYNTAMKRMMRNPYEYHHDLGSFFDLISIIVLYHGVLPFWNLRLSKSKLSLFFFLLCLNVGMNYTIIRDNLIVGSQPQKPEDIDHLKEEEHVKYILCLQQDSDIEYWGIDFDSILSRCKELGIHHMRAPVSAGITFNLPWTIFYLGFS
jgi:hypothetical protein